LMGGFLGAFVSYRFVQPEKNSEEQNRRNLL
jgi:hypothetical protein